MSGSGLSAVTARIAEIREANATAAAAAAGDGDAPKEYDLRNMRGCYDQSAMRHFFEDLSFDRQDAETIAALRQFTRDLMADRHVSPYTKTVVLKALVVFDDCLCPSPQEMRGYVQMLLDYNRVTEGYISAFIQGAVMAPFDQRPIIGPKDPQSHKRGIYSHVAEGLMELATAQGGQFLTTYARATAVHDGKIQGRPVISWGESPQGNITQPDGGPAFRYEVIKRAG